MSKKVTIIGGSGFIGSELIRQLKDHNDIENIDKKKSKIVETKIADIRDKKTVNENLSPDTDTVILLAAEHKDNVTPPRLYYDVNVTGTKNILELMREKKINRIIFTSTVAVYGLNKDNPNEEHPVNPFNEYGKTKYMAEDLLRAWYKEDPGIRSLVIIRPTVVFGVENRGNVYNLLHQILKGNFKMVGRGRNKKSMSYVENIVAFIKYVVHNMKPGYELYNYVDKPDLTTRELINTISKSANKKISSLSIPYPIGYIAGLMFDLLGKITGKEQSISSVRIKKFCATTQFSSDKIKNETNFTPPYTLEEGLNKTIESLL